MKIRVDGAWRDVPAVSLRIGASWKQATRAVMFIGNAWKEVASFIPPLTVAINPPSTSGISRNFQPINSPLITATPTGGKAPYSYGWNVILGDGNFTTNSPSSGAFTANAAPGDVSQTQVRCTVTSADGQTAQAIAFFTVTGVSSGGGGGEGVPQN